MFERYTEKARRVIFFARYEASQFGSPYIETEHLLLGLLREDKALTNRFLRSHSTVESIRKQIEKNTEVREKVSTSVDLPLSNECKRVLAYAAEEAQALGHRHLGTEHLLLGLLREEGSFAAAILDERGVKLETVRQGMEETPHPISEMRGVHLRESGAPAGPTALTDFTRDLTQAALDGQLEPLVGRGQELDAMIEVLSGSMRANPLLLGEGGVGKSAIVEGLAQRLEFSDAPPALAEKRLVAVDSKTIAGWQISGRSEAEDRITQMIKVLIGASGFIFFIDDLQLFSTAIVQSGSPVSASIVKHWLTQRKLQCIGACTPEEFRSLMQTAPWIAECFKAIHISPLDSETTLEVLQARKQRLETMHGVSYSQDALACAVESVQRYLPQGRLPGKALELIDAAGARVKLCRAAPPVEVADCMKRIEHIVKRMQGAIENHEFERARFYSEEEKKERENLRILHTRYHLDEGPALEVTRADVEKVIERWARYPYVQ